MALTPDCGHHCGAISDPLSGHGTERHCDCPECHDGGATPLTFIQIPQSPRRRSMADQWYERAGDYRPWCHHGYRPAGDPA